MYDEIQKLIAPNYLTPFEYTKLEELKQTYTEDEILYAYKNSAVKNINYIIKVLQKKKTPQWLNKEIKNESLDTKTIKEFNEFQDFIKEFRK